MDILTAHKSVKKNVNSDVLFRLCIHSKSRSLQKARKLQEMELISTVSSNKYFKDELLLAKMDNSSFSSSKATIALV